eukprot:4924496-Amphidinium_carterae.1
MVQTYTKYRDQVRIYIYIQKPAEIHAFWRLEQVRIYISSPWHKSGFTSTTGQDLHLHRPLDQVKIYIYIYKTTVRTIFWRDLTRSGYTSTASAMVDSIRLGGFRGGWSAL